MTLKVGCFPDRWSIKKLSLTRSTYKEPPGMCPFCQVGRPAGWVLPTTIKNYKRTANTTTLVCYICNIGQPTRRTNLKSSVVSSFHFSFSSNFFSFFSRRSFKEKITWSNVPSGATASIQCQHTMSTFLEKNTCLVGMTSRVNLRSIDICLILPYPEIT